MSVFDKDLFSPNGKFRNDSRVFLKDFLMLEIV